MSSIVDLHIHTCASDGTDAPDQVLEKLLEQGVHTFAVTDHDTVDGSLTMGTLVPPGVRFIRGIEFSCTAPRGKCHILGYGFDHGHPAFRRALETGRQRRMENLEKRLAFLKSEFNIALTRQEMDWLMALPSPGKPHLARILMDRGLAKDVGEAIRTYINPCKSGEDRIPADMAVQAIAHAGGIPVWAHPLGGEGERRISREEFSLRLAALMEYGIRGLECCYCRYGEEDTAFLLDQARTHGLLVSGGSDYHGSNKQGIGLGMLNQADTPVDPTLLTVLDVL